MINASLTLDIEGFDHENIFGSAMDIHRRLFQRLFLESYLIRDQYSYDPLLAPEELGPPVHREGSGHLWAAFSLVRLLVIIL
ncbi:MAG: hypothetical protein CMM47_06755 [Rhodospirillaceae bacterium]|nr:hypothetical protein [Rhodospirillaceae bacterium]